MIIYHKSIKQSEHSCVLEDRIRNRNERNRSMGIRNKVRVQRTSCHGDLGDFFECKKWHLLGVQRLRVHKRKGEGSNRNNRRMVRVQLIIKIRSKFQFRLMLVFKKGKIKFQNCKDITFGKDVYI